jgi:hypothetical protein
MKMESKEDTSKEDTLEVVDTIYVPIPGIFQFEVKHYPNIDDYWIYLELDKSKCSIWNSFKENNLVNIFKKTKYGIYEENTIDNWFDYAKRSVEYYTMEKERIYPDILEYSFNEKRMIYQSKFSNYSRKSLLQNDIIRLDKNIFCIHLIPNKMIEQVNYYLNHQLRIEEVDIYDLKINVQITFDNAEIKKNGIQNMYLVNIGKNLIII